MNNQLRSIGLMLCRFSTQTGKPRKSYINIAKLVKQQEQSASNINTNTRPDNKPKFNPKDFSPKIQQQDIYLKDPTSNPWQQSTPTQSGFSHLSAEEQQINHKIKTAIRSETIYHLCTKNKHKLEVRHYALMFCKILELRKNSSNERKETQSYADFLVVIEKKVQSMPPEELVRMVHAIKYEGVSKKELKLLMPIVQKIIKQFSNAENNELEPKSFQTLKLSTNIKLFHSFLFLFEQTGSHFQVKLKQIMNEALTYILFRSMKTKKHTKSGEYFPIGLKMSFLSACKNIEASPICIKNLIISVLAEKERITQQNLLDLQAVLFDSAEVLEKTRKQLFTQKDVHTKYNILYRIEKYIEERIPTNLKKSSTYALLTRKLVRHLSLISQLTFDELKVIELSSKKDQQVFKVLSLFHQAYKNYLIENYASINEKQDAVAFFNKSQNLQYALYELLTFFYLKLKNDGVNAIRPSTKKELKDFVGLLCKFYGKLNFLTQSIIIELLAIGNFTNLKPILTQYLELNTFTTGSSRVQRAHFFSRDRTKMLDNFFEMMKYESTFRQQCPVHYDVFINSNIKNLIKFIFKSTEPINIEKYAFYMAAYCKPSDQQKLKFFIDQVIKVHIKQSWSNRSFKKEDVEIIYKNKEQFMAPSSKPQAVQLQNQTDIFGQNISKKEEELLFQSEKIIGTLQNDREFMREYYNVEHKIRQKLRRLFRNFKFIILFFENLKIVLSKESYQTVINEDIYVSLLSNFKTQIQCLKFERLFTKQNCSQFMEIYEFMNGLWAKTLSNVEVRNQFLMHKNQKLKESLNQTQHIDIRPKEDANLDTSLNKQKRQQKLEIMEQEEDESQQGQYTEQIEYLKGKDLLSLQTIKGFNEKRSKSQGFFASKNKECLLQIQLLTNGFAQHPKSLQNPNQKAQFLKKLVHHYTEQNKYTSQLKVENLASLDKSKIAQQNLKEVLSLQVQKKATRALYGLRIFTKEYPNLRAFALRDNKENLTEQNNGLAQIYYVHSSKVRRNKKKLQQEQQGLKSTENSKEKSSQSKEEIQSGILDQNPNKESL